MEPLIIAVVGFGASFVKSAFGLGAGVLFAPVLALFFEPRLAVGMTAPIMFLSSVASIHAYWRRWDWPLLRSLLPPALLGLLLGSYFLASAPAPLLRRTIGLVAVSFAMQQLLRLRRAPGAGEAPAPPGGAVLYGLCGGVVSGIAHAGGLFFSMYLLPRLGKAAFVASLTLTLLVVDTFRLISFGYLGVLEGHHVFWALLFAPIMIAGSRAGRALNGRLSERGFVAVVTALVAATGALLLVR